MCPADTRNLQRSAALKIDWAKVTSALGLRGQTAASLQAFKKRNDDARRKVQQLSEQPQTVDFDYYRRTLKNQAIVDEIENYFKNFKPATYDLSRQLKAIDAFEAQAIKSAEETKGRVEAELANLRKTLENIETARPFEDLTVVCLSGRLFVIVGYWSNGFPLCQLGRGCCRSARNRREDRSARFQGQVDAAGLQGALRRSVCAVIARNGWSCCDGRVSLVSVLVCGTGCVYRNSVQLDDVRDASAVVHGEWARSLVHYSRMIFFLCN